MMVKEYLAEVDIHDRVLGRITYEDMREKNLLHRSSTIIVVNSRGELLIQKRAASKRIYPGYHSMGAGGCVRYDETYDQTAVRELAEELGIRGVPLTPFFKHTFQDAMTRVIDQVYLCTYDGPISIQKEELDSFQWVPLSDVPSFVKSHPFEPLNLEPLEIFLKEHAPKASSALKGRSR